MLQVFATRLSPTLVSLKIVIGFSVRSRGCVLHHEPHSVYSAYSLAEGVPCTGYICCSTPGMFMD
jgi:hypothetical protein